ncbi:hypothetical protein K431DRAFT_61006 [Polychaeton citri CBS 116435]|uniref:Uncharacterized protein n=1 Tax=Polychaeton citri CBS 116435 TaxID=1314669 RepID=A0A9P4Q7Q2_9PEZI|nr:hypothetical protein K431DRAFT_61006 [Polychaeton citri CBS 116435]
MAATSGTVVFGVRGPLEWSDASRHVASHADFTTQLTFLRARLMADANGSAIITIELQHVSTLTCASPLDLDAATALCKTKSACITPAVCLLTPSGQTASNQRFLDFPSGAVDWMARAPAFISGASRTAAEPQTALTHRLRSFLLTWLLNTPCTNPCMPTPSCWHRARCQSTVDAPWLYVSSQMGHMPGRLPTWMTGWEATGQGNLTRYPPNRF